MAALEDVYCTLVMNDGYLPGAAVLAHSLRDSGSTKKLACLVTVDSLRASTLDELRSLYNYVIPVPRIGTPSPKNLYLMNRADLLYTFTKIHLWRQVQFRKIIYIDADVVALRAPEELFDIQDTFAAAPDVGWPDIFNSGVMVISPNEGDYRALQNMAAAGDSFDGADQGLLNQYYEHKPWKRLSFAYNCTPSANYQYEPAYRYFKRDISLVHFIGNQKPWSSERNHAGSNAYGELLSRWWSVYDRHITSSPFDYIEGIKRQPPPSSYSTNTAASTGDTLSASGYPTATTLPAPPPVPSAVSAEVPSTERHKHGHVTHRIGAPAVGSRPPFAAPHMEWDATRAPPPIESRPEAANFPSQVYEFNPNRELFHAPAQYPEPPKNMWFEVPAERPKKVDRPAPIFPWEEREVPRPTRRFADDAPELPSLPSQAELKSEDDMDFGEFEVNNDEPSGLSTPTITITSETSWDAYGANNRNAWDEVSGIENYVRALTSRQRNRGKVQIVHSSDPMSPGQTSTIPQLSDDVLENLKDKVNERRESLILTDFPTAVERPSLPVTPAPRRRVTFWGKDDENEVDEKLPQAHGVPHQADWDPAEQLEQLRRNSLIGADNLKLLASRQIPTRESVSTAAPIPDEVLNHPVVLAQDIVSPTPTETAAS